MSTIEASGLKVRRHCLGEAVGVGVSRGVERALEPIEAISSQETS